MSYHATILLQIFVAQNEERKSIPLQHQFSWAPLAMTHPRRVIPYPNSTTLKIGQTAQMQKETTMQQANNTEIVISSESFDSI